MKKLLCFFLVILVLVSPALAADGSTLVYTTRTGECYHRYSCSSLSKSCYETTLSQAVADGYRPCGRCHPPTLDSGSSGDDSSKSALDRYFEERGYGSTHSSGSSSGSSSAKPSLSDRIAANNSSGSSSGSSCSGYSSGSSSYRSYVPTHTPEEIKREKTIDLIEGILVIVFVYPPLSFISWGLIIEGAKKIFKKKK